jgi:hypothetical protein
MLMPTHPKPSFGPSRGTVLAASQKRGNHRSNLWLHYSWRNRADVILIGNPAFLHFLWLEADPTVRRYRLEHPEVIVRVGNDEHKTVFDADVERIKGQRELHEVKADDDDEHPKTVREQHQRDAQLRAAKAENAAYVRIGPATLAPHRQLIDNWLQACGYLAACRWHDLDTYSARLLLGICDHDPVTLESLLCGTEIDYRPLYIAAFFELHQQGRIITNLASQPFSLRTTASLPKVLL